MGKYTGVGSECAVPVDTKDAHRLSTRASPPVMAQVVVGTPGTTRKWISNEKLSVTRLKILVFDEADQMLAEDGFQDDSLRIMNRVRKDSPNCQVLLFSATFNDTVRNFVSKIVKQDYNQLFVKKEELSLEAVKQCKVNCPDELSKIEVIRGYIFEIGGKPLYSCEEGTVQACCISHSQIWAMRSVPYKALFHMNRETRLSRSSEMVNLVVNYDLPVKHTSEHEPDYEVYLHRVGRAG